MRSCTTESPGDLVLEVGDRIPLEATVWVEPRKPATFAEILADGPILLLFYLFDWSPT